MTAHFRTTLFLTAAVLCLARTTAPAQDRTAKLEERVAALERQVDELKSLLLQPTAERAGLDSTKGKASSQRNWNKLEIGMNERQVRAILGEPHRLQTLSSLTYWYYEGGAGYIRPYVSFDNDSHAVYGWTQP